MVTHCSVILSFVVGFFCLLIVDVEGKCCICAHSLTHTHTHSMIPLYGGSARRRDLCLTTHHAHNKRQTFIPLAVFEPTSARSQTYALDHAASGIACSVIRIRYFKN